MTFTEGDIVKANRLCIDRLALVGYSPNFIKRRMKDVPLSTIKNRCVDVGVDYRKYKWPEDSLSVLIHDADQIIVKTTANDLLLGTVVDNIINDLKDNPTTSNGGDLVYVWCINADWYLELLFIFRKTEIDSRIDDIVKRVKEMLNINLGEEQELSSDTNILSKYVPSLYEYWPIRREKLLKEIEEGDRLFNSIPGLMASSY